MSKNSTSEEEWRNKLTKEQYHVLREKGTERAFSGALLNNKEKGTYYCAACGNLLYDSQSKYDSGSGWPSFFEPAKEGAIELELDKSLGMIRTEVRCGNCGSHLGHVFEDGPKPTGQRYCMNSAAMKFKKD